MGKKIKLEDSIFVLVEGIVSDDSRAQRTVKELLSVWEKNQEIEKEAIKTKQMIIFPFSLFVVIQFGFLCEYLVYEKGFIFADIFTLKFMIASFLSLCIIIGFSYGICHVVWMVLYNHKYKKRKLPYAVGEKDLEHLNDVIKEQCVLLADKDSKEKFYYYLEKNQDSLEFFQESIS